MGILLEKIKGYLEFFAEQSREHKLLLVLVISIFCPFFISGFVALGMMIYTLASRERRAPVLQVPGAGWLFAAAALMAVLALFNQNYIGLLASILAAVIFFIALYARRYMTRALFGTILDLSCALSFPCALVAVIQKILLQPGQFIYRPVSTFLNANYYGCFTEMLILICLCKLTLGVGAKKRPFYYATIAVNLVGLVLCNSFSAWFGIFGGVMLLLILRKHYRWCYGILIGMGAIVIIAFAVPELAPRLTDFSQIYHRRFEIWDLALHGVERHPFFGQGLLSYLKLSTESQAYVQPHAHNIYLDAVLNFGILGVPVVLAYFTRQFSKLFKRYKTTPNRDVYILIFVLTAGCLVHGVTDVTILWLQTGLFAMLMLSGLGIDENEEGFYTAQNDQTGDLESSGQQALENCRT